MRARGGRLGRAQIGAAQHDGCWRSRAGRRPKKDDSAEVYVGEEFVGVLFVDDEDDERSYNFQMAILAADLD